MAKKDNKNTPQKTGLAPDCAYWVNCFCRDLAAMLPGGEVVASGLLRSAACSFSMQILVRPRCSCHSLSSCTPTTTTNLPLLVSSIQVNLPLSYLAHVDNFTGFIEFFVPALLGLFAAAASAERLHWRCTAITLALLTWSLRLTVFLLFRQVLSPALVPRAELPRGPGISAT